MKGQFKVGIGNYKGSWEPPWGAFSKTPAEMDLSGGSSGEVLTKAGRCQLELAPELLLNASA